MQELVALIFYINTTIFCSHGQESMDRVNAVFRSLYFCPPSCLELAGSVGFNFQGS